MWMTWQAKSARPSGEVPAAVVRAAAAVGVGMYWVGWHHTEVKVG